MKHSTVYGATTVIGIVFATSFLMVSLWLGSLHIPDTNHYPVETTVTFDVSVNNTDPLVLTVNMKSLYRAYEAESTGFMIVADADIEFDDGYIQDDNQTVVAHCLRTVPFGFSSDGRGHWAQHFIVCMLATNSTRTVTLNSNTTLPPGSYCLTLYTHGNALYSDNFTIP